MLEKSLVDIKLGTFAVANSTALKDPALLPQVQNYKRQVASRMYPLGKSDIERKIPEAKYHVSRKIDGEFNALIYREGELVTLNPGGRVRLGMPWQEEALKMLKATGWNNAILAGELYVVPNEDRRSRVHDVVSVARQPKSKEDLERIRFAVFDIIAIDDDQVETDYPANWDIIEKHFSGGEKIHPVETVMCKGHREIKAKFSEWVEEQGAEGIVVRSPSAGNFKIKPRHNLDVVVIGFTESTEDRTGMMHDLLMAVARQDGSLQVLGRVGGGFTDDNRREMLSDLKDMVVESEYAEVNSDHVAYQMVRPEWIIEISCLDLIAQNTRGGNVNRMVLNWNTTESRYEVVRRLPLVSIISPQFVRIREDKTMNSSDVRLSQISDIVPIAMANVDATEMSLPTSQILQREVYTKTLRGDLMVRKFLMWKTNKEGDSEEFPAYVMHYTDFSPSRKSPINREVRVSNSETQMIALWHQFKEEYIKKGWEIHSSSGSLVSDPVKEIDDTPKENDSEQADEEPKKKAVKKKAAKKKPAKKKAAKKSVKKKAAKKKTEKED